LASRFEADRIHNLRGNMEKETILEAIEKLKDLIEEISDQDQEDEIVASLHEDYNAFFTWAIGDESDKKDKYSKEEMCKKWKRMHPGLPLPRVFQTEADLGKCLSTVCLFMDAYPLFLQSID